MKPVFEKIIGRRAEESIFAMARSEARFARNWHHHPECELTLITRGSGRRLVGDHGADYRAGDLVFLGPEVPHTWISGQGSGARRVRNEAVVIQFREAVIAGPLLDLPEFRDLAGLFRQARLGVFFPGVVARNFRGEMGGVLESTGYQRWLALAELLTGLASRERVTLASPGYAAKSVTRARTRLERVVQFVDEHASGPLSLEEVAKVAGLSPSAFQRFFRAAMRKPFVRYRSERRIANACERLATTDDPVTHIAFECGFGSLASFNRQFKAITGVSATRFRKGSPLS